MKKSILFIYLFIFALMIPAESSIYVGPMRLAPYRIFLIFVFIPCLVAIARGRVGFISTIDVLVVVQPIWVFSAYAFNNTFGQIWQGSGMNFIETVVPYAVARCFIRSRQDFQRTINTALLSVAVLLPVALIEVMTGRYLKTILYGSIEIHMAEEEMRLGMHRAFTVFDHPILYGVFCASIFGLAFYYRSDQKSLFWPATKIAAIAGGVFFSLSSGPMLAFVAQGLLIVWEQLTRRLPNRFSILAILFVLMYVAIDILSNRTPFVVMASYLSLNAGTATGRAIIWEVGMENVAKNPIFGLGLNDWERWDRLATSSMDAFWLFLAVFYGLPGALLMVTAVLILIVRLGRAKLSLEDSRCRMGWMISIIGLSIAGTGVHYWGQIYVWFMFLLGSSAWMLEQSPSRAVAAESQGSGMPIVPQGEREGRGAQTISGQTDTAASRDAKAPARFCRPEDTRWLKSDD